MTRLVETVFPARLGHGFRWLVGSSWVTNLGDGVLIAAGPLLIASQTRNPVLVSSAMIALQAPWLVFGLVAGALADRLDRRRVIMAANLARGLVLAMLCAVIATGHVNIGIVLGAMLLLGTAEVFVDATAGTLTPMLVDKSDLGIANSRLMAGMLTGNQLVGPAVGALLFSVGMVYPFSVTVVCIVVGVLLVSRIGTAPGAVREHVDTHVRQDIADGVRWLMGNPPVRTLAIIIVVFNVTWAAPWAVLVLWALERVGINEAGFGLLDHRVRPRWPARDVLLRLAREAGAARHPHAHGAAVRGALPPRHGADHLALGGVPAHVLLRGVRLRVGHALVDRPAARGAHGAPGSCRLGLHDLRDGRHARRLAPRRPDRRHRGAHGSVVVRLRRRRRDAGAGVAVARADRPRRRDDRAAT